MRSFSTDTGDPDELISFATASDCEKVVTIVFGVDTYIFVHLFK